MRRWFRYFGATLGPVVCRGVRQLPVHLRPRKVGNSVTSCLDPILVDAQWSIGSASRDSQGRRPLLVRRSTRHYRHHLTGRSFSFDLTKKGAAHWQAISPNVY
jgi:hypothetical protein